MMAHVFVYGSLKRGFSNQHWLKGQRFLRQASTAPLYRMFDYGGFPALVQAAELGLSGRNIAGELWAVDPATLDRLDILEGVGQGLYWRAQIDLQEDHRGTGKTAAIGYLYLRDVSGLPDVGTCWTSAMDHSKDTFPDIEATG